MFSLLTYRRRSLLGTSYLDFFYNRILWLSLWFNFFIFCFRENDALYCHRRSLFRTSNLIVIFYIFISIVYNRLCLWINYSDIISSIDCASASHRRSLFRTSNLIFAFYIFYHSFVIGCAYVSNILMLFLV